MRLFIAVILILILFLMCTYFDNNRLTVRKYKIKAALPKGKKLKIVHISDIHKKTFPDNWKRIISTIKNLEPDLIFITGDIVSRTETDFDYKGKLIEGLCKICPVYCSNGNHELDLSDECMEKYKKMLVNSGAFLLDNLKAEFKIDDMGLNIYGADLKKSIYVNKNGGYKNLEKYRAEELDNIFGKPEGLSILLAHNPFFFDEYAKWGADITFSGHVHGGAVNTPFGGLLSPERKFFPKYTKGIYEIYGKKMVLSAGIGKLRLFNPPEIVLAEIYN